jgi:hypothetical protein
MKYFLVGESSYPFPDIEREARKWVKKDYAKWKQRKKIESKLMSELENFTIHEDKFKNIWIIPKKSKMKKVV